MSHYAVPASLRRISIVPAPRDSRVISEIPPPLTVAPRQLERQLDFATLPRVVQDRFLSAIEGTFPPSPLLRSVEAVQGGATIAWAAVALCATATFGALFRRGFGALDQTSAIQAPAMAVVYGALVAVVVLAVMRAIASLLEARVLPYAAGVYLFPTTLVDARRATLDALPLADVVAVEPHDHAIHLVFGSGRRFAFALDRNACVPDVVAMVEAACDRAKELAAEPDPSGHYALVDPLYEPQETMPSSSEPRLSLRVPPWARFASVAALVLGTIAGPALRRLHNVACDTRIFAKAHSAGTVEAYRAYLALGGAHHDEVEQTLLPRAIDAARRAAMRIELGVAIEKGTLSALRAFAKSHPDHGLDGEFADANHGVYAAALERYRLRAPDAEALAFFTRLLAFSEAHGPTVHVQFSREPSPDLARADRDVGRSPRFAGGTSYPSQYFDAPHDETGEAILLAALRARFASVFPAELLSFEPIARPVVATAPAVPTLTITHHVEWSGGTVESTSPPGVYVELSYELDARFVVPGSESRLAISSTVPSRPLPALTKLERANGKPSPEETFYAAQSSDAFERFAGTWTAQLLR